jgi:hypothetical protein
MEILWGHPALLLEDALVVGDLHIGLEQELFSKGVRVPSLTNRMKDSIKNLLLETRADKLVLLGDLKHRIAAISAQEAREIPSFLRELSSFAELRIVLGNHDGGLKPLLSSFKVFPATGFVYKKQCLIHGSAKPLKKHLKKSKGIIASHWHPVFEFKDNLGGRMTEKAWVKAKAFDKELLMMPSFNPLLGGVPFHKIKDKWVDLKKAEVYLLDGVCLGQVN